MSGSNANMIQLSRYAVLRALGCGPITAATISALNYIADVRPGLIVLLFVEIEYGNGGVE